MQLLAQLQNSFVQKKRQFNQLIIYSNISMVAFL